MSRNTQNTQKLAILSVLVALQIVLARFCSFNAWNARIGIGFLPVAVALNQLVFSLLLNTLWISILYGADFRGLLSSRFLQLLVIAPIQFLLLSVLSSVWERTGLRQALRGIASDEIV